MSRSAANPAAGLAKPVIVSNRLPVSVLVGGGELRLEASSGGLVAALRGIERAAWVGWPGAAVPRELEAEGSALLATEGCRPVFLSGAEEEAFYGRICNETLWPLFHYFVDRMRFDSDDWQTYVEVNERFAETAAEVSPPGAHVWIHDFHLALVPDALRRRRPDVAIGFFLHVPFPSSEIYRLLPARSEILLGMLGSDYIGFHTGDYVRHFRSACLRVLGIASELDAIGHEGRTIGLGAHPIGIDVDRFRETLRAPETAALHAEIDERYRGKQLILGIERLDYTKGIPEKLHAFERVLEQDPARAGSTVMLQVLVPSRLESPEYRSKLYEIEGRVGHMNGRFGGLAGSPVDYVHRSISHAGLAALYRRADVMMVTPLRDGMNLVAQEFVLCQSDGADLPGGWRGVLLLSEFAGAANVLPGALLVNPWDSHDLSRRLVEALALGPAERRRRLELMADRVAELDAKRWARGFLDQLERSTVASGSGRTQPLDESASGLIGRRFGRAQSRTLLLDYDGTLRELVSHPGLAAPTAEIRDLLRDLAALPCTSVHLVSGRRRETLDGWFGDLPIHLGAEHGYFERRAGAVWRVSGEVDLAWLPRVESLFEEIAADVPETLVERKSAGVAWHYRRAEPEYSSWRAREVLAMLDQVLAGVSAEVLPGHYVIEVRARGVSKGAYVERLLRSGRESRSLILAAGDDRTDLDLYRALPVGAVALHVGGVHPLANGAGSCDRYTVPSPRELRGLLRALGDQFGWAPAAAAG